MTFIIFSDWCWFTPSTFYITGVRHNRKLLLHTLFGISNKVAPNENIYYKLCKIRINIEIFPLLYFSPVCEQTLDHVHFWNICQYFKIASMEQILYLFFGCTCLRKVYERAILVLEQPNRLGKYSFYQSESNFTVYFLF